MAVEGLKAGKKPVPVRIVHDEVAPCTASKSERNYRAEDALRDIKRAEQHKSDKSLMADVKKLAKQELSSLKKLC